MSKSKISTPLRKLTVMVEAELLENALKESGSNIASTVHKALELLCSQRAYRKLAALKGKVKCSLKLETLRDDR